MARDRGVAVRRLDRQRRRTQGLARRPGIQENESGRHIVRLLRTKRGELSDDDYGEMRRVVGYVHRHLAQEPTKEELATSRWSYSLMNWGHDPLKRG